MPTNVTLKDLTPYLRLLLMPTPDLDQPRTKAEVPESGVCCWNAGN